MNNELKTLKINCKCQVSHIRMLIFRDVAWVDVKTNNQKGETALHCITVSFTKQTTGQNYSSLPINHHHNNNSQEKQTGQYMPM